MKFISPKIHAILDYLTVIFLVASPSIFKLSQTASYLCYFLGAVHLLLTVFSKSHGGLIKIVPLKIHGMVEMLVSLGLGVLAFTLFKGMLRDQWFFVVLSITIMIIFLLTDYRRRTFK